MHLDLSSFSAAQVYHLMTQTIIPRPIAWALTDSGNQVYNLAPFSYFTAVSSAPPLMMLSAGKKPTGERKDTVVNAEQTGKLVIHIAGQQDADLVTQTAATLAHGESEVRHNDIALTEFEGFVLPRVKQCDIAFGCSLYEIKEIGDTPQSLLFVKVEQVYLSDEVTAQDNKGRLRIDAAAVDPLARLGGGEYVGITLPFSHQRPE